MTVMVAVERFNGEASAIEHGAHLLEGREVLQTIGDHDKGITVARRDLISTLSLYRARPLVDSAVNNGLMTFVKCQLC